MSERERGPDFIRTTLLLFLTVAIALFLSHLVGGMMGSEAVKEVMELSLSVLGSSITIYFVILRPLRRESDFLWETSNIDKLTDVYNRRYFVNALDREFRRSDRHGRPLSVLMMDLDDFKKVNDQYGHAAGDNVLVEITRTIRSRMRGYCTLARYGGEEFVLMIPEADVEHAHSIAEQIRKMVAEKRVLVDTILKVPVTISIGVAQYDPTLDATPDGLINRADVALYRAKNEGKNRSVIYSAE